MQNIRQLVDDVLRHGIEGPAVVDANWCHWAARRMLSGEFTSKHALNVAQDYLQYLANQGELSFSRLDNKWRRATSHRMSGTELNAAHQSWLARNRRLKAQKQMTWQRYQRASRVLTLTAA